MLFIILVLLLSIPAVQTRLGKYATKKVNEKHNTNINIEKVGLQFNGDVELKNIYIEDYKQDTLISIDELNTSILSFKKLYDNKFTFGDVDIYGMLLNIKTYEGAEDTNLDIFSEKFDSDSKSENIFLLSSSDVSLYDSEFRIWDENKENSNILIFENLNINATDFVIRGPEVKARINKLAFLDSRGVEVKNLSTNFTYSLNKMHFEFLQIKTLNSVLNGDLIFEYDREDIQDFENKVQLTATFNDSEIALNELNTFYDEFGKNQKAKFNTTLFGTLNDLTASQLQLTTSRQTNIDGTINFKNLFNNEEGNFVMDGNFNNLSSTYMDLRNLLPNVLGKALPSTLERLGKFTINGISKVTSTTIDADIDINTGLGLLIAELKLDEIDNIDNASYNGNIVLDEFNVGEFINDTKVGLVSLNLDVDGKGFTLEQLNTQVIGDVYGLNYNDYYYSNINVSGIVKNKVFNGALNTKDTNIDLAFNGLIDFTKDDNKYDFSADVTHANLRALNFVKNDSLSIFKGLVDMNMKGTNIDDAYGTVTFKNTLYQNQDDDYYFKDFTVSSRFEEDIRFIKINSPDIMEGELSGKFLFKDALKLVENSIGNIYTNYKPHDIANDQFIDFNFRIYNKIAEVFIPDLNFGSNTIIRGRVESDAKKFNVTFKSPQINLKENFANNIELSINNSNPLYNTLIEIDSVHTKFYDVSEFSFVNVTKADTLFVKSEFKGGKTNKDYFDLNLFYTINEENKSVIGFRRSDVEFKGNTWTINQINDSKNKIQFEKGLKNIILDDLTMQHMDESILLSGIIQDENNKNIDLNLSDVDLVKIAPEIDQLELEGNINGDLDIVQQEGIYIPRSDVTIDNFKVNQVTLGSFKAEIIGNESLTNYNVDISLREDSTESLAITGNIDVAGKNSSINLDVNFDQFVLDPLNPFGDGNITNIRGQVAGSAKVTGQLKRPQITGTLDLDDAGLTVPYLNVDYELEDDTVVTLANQSFIFNNAQLTDSEYFSRAFLSGYVNHVNFSSWSLDLNMNSDRLLVLDTEDSEDALYYGTAFVDGTIDINGPTEQLIISAEVASEEGTVIKIPLNDTDAFGDSSYIHFLSPEEKEARLMGEIVSFQEIKGLEMDFDLTVNENAEIEIVLDRNSGSTIKGRGNGGLLAQINTNGKFNMYGDFIVSEGVYNFFYGGIIQKKFDVLPGGTLVWEGDPLQAEINIEAVYDDIQANPSILLDNPINRSIPVEVKIHLTERLEQPSFDFDLSFPNVNTTLNSELQYRLDDAESRQFQALSLLATGTFRNELNFDTQDAIGLVSDRATALLNDLISSEDGKLQLGFDVDLGERNPDYETDSRVGVTLSTRLSDRILINGKVGVPVGGVNETVVAGDVEIELLLNEDRTLSLKVFNRENSIRNFGEQIGYTQGLGLSYNVEFDNLKELFEIIFRGNNDKAIEKNPEIETNSAVPGYMNFKSKDTTSTKISNQKKD